MNTQLERVEKGPSTPSSDGNLPVAAPAVIDHVADEIVEIKEKERGPRDFLRVFGYNDTLGWVLNIIALVACIASGVVLPLMDVVFGQFVNVFNDSATGTIDSTEYRRQINKFSLYFIYLFVAKFATTYIWTVLVSITAIRTTAKLRVDFVRQTLRQEVSFFDTPSSSVSAQITTNGNLINTAISEKLGLIIQACSTFVAAFIVAFVVQWKLTLIVCCIVPVNLGVTLVCAYFDTMLEYKMFDIYSQASSLAEEAFSNIRTAHAFWVFPQLAKRFNGFLDRARKVGKKKSLIYAVLFPTEFFCIFSGYGLAFWQGMRMYSSGEIENVGTVVTVIFAILVAAQALTQLLPQTITITRAVAAAQQLFAIIDRESRIDSLADEGAEIPNFEGDIKFRNVRFAYPSRSDVPVLHGLDLDLPAGKSTALVGASGSGKSTIFGLLERWYNPERGSLITLDGRQVESLNLRWLRTNIRLVQQEPTLFSGSIYQNIVDGLVGTDLASVSEDEKHALVVKAAQSAYAHDFIEALPKGYDTYIGERGASLSGGQKQRIVIARSIISNPKVLLLDEATSALDPNAEKIVQQALNNVGKGRTMITIAHRLSTIRDADRIVVMSKGVVVEQGTHDELIELGGSYANLVKAQDLSKRDNEDDASDDSEDGKPVDLDMVATQATEPGSLVEATELEKQKQVGLLRGIFLIIREQRILWVPLFFSFLACIGGGITFPALAVLFAETMDAFAKVDVSRANFFALMFFVVALGNLVVYCIAGWIANVLGQQVMRFYRSEIFDNTLRQDMVFFDKAENSTGALVSRLSSEPTSLQELLSINLFLMAINLVNLLSSSIVAIAFGWKLGLVLALGALPVLVGAGYMRIRLEFKFEEDTAARFAASSGLASESVMAIRTVSSLALERAVIERYRNSLTGIARDALKSVGWKMLFYALSQSLSFLCMGLGFWYGGHLVADGEYSNNQFYVAFTAIVFSGESTAQFFQYTTSITKARPAVNYILSLRKSITMKDETEADNKEADAETKPLLGGSDVRCEDIHFSYPLRPNIPVLKGIDAQIGSGKNVAFVGASGCGKSTMIALLQRFYDPTRGVLRFNDSDIKTVDRQGHRRDIALVQQEPVLYQGSIRENIAMGVADEDPSDEDLIEACKQANIWTFISSLPEGLSTPCGNQGLSLSGGQRQRIAIARALVRKPRLLLLDEATSALDTESEKIVKEALDKASEGRSTVAVAHRLSTIRDADLICVFDKGRIKEMGTHDELVTKKGMYYEMVLGQSLDKEAT